jgi:Tfp pilus assembly protein PilN
MRAVNLLPRDEQRERFQNARTSLFLAGGGVMVATALAMFLAYSAGGDASDSRAQLQAVETEIANLPKVADAVVTHGTIVRERSERVAALSAALSTRVPFDRLLREISFVLPGDAWLTQLDATAPVSTVPAVAGATPPPPTSTTPVGVSIEGATYSHDSVARVLARLSVVPSLENVRLTSSARVEPRKESPSGEGAAELQGPRRPFVTFIVTASLRTGATR